MLEETCFQIGLFIEEMPFIKKKIIQFSYKEKSWAVTKIKISLEEA